MRTLIRTLAVLCGLIGLLTAFNFWGMISHTDPALFERMAEQLDAETQAEARAKFGEDYAATVWYALLTYYFVESVVGVTILYGLWTMRTWGRYLAIFYGGAWLLQLLLFQTVLSTPAVAQTITWGVALLRAFTVSVCLRRDVKELMCN